MDYRQPCKPDKPLIVVWGDIKIMDKFDQRAEDLWVALHENQLVAHGVTTARPLSYDHPLAALNYGEEKDPMSTLKIDQLMVAIGYREYSGTCGTCKCVEVKEHPAVECEWILTCTYANHPTLHFVTKSHHTCNMWQLKQ